MNLRLQARAATRPSRYAIGEEEDDDDRIRGKTLNTHTQHRRASAYFSVEGKELYLVVSQVPCPFLSSFLPSHALPKDFPKDFRMFLCWLSPSVRRERLQKKNLVFFHLVPDFEECSLGASVNCF